MRAARVRAHTTLLPVLTPPTHTHPSPCLGTGHSMMRLSPLPSRLSSTCTCDLHLLRNETLRQLLGYVQMASAGKSVQPRGSKAPVAGAGGKAKPALHSVHVTRFRPYSTLGRTQRWERFKSVHITGSQLKAVAGGTAETDRDALMADAVRASLCPNQGESCDFVSNGFIPKQMSMPKLRKKYERHLKQLSYREPLFAATRVSASGTTERAARGLAPFLEGFASDKTRAEKPRTEPSMK